MNNSVTPAKAGVHELRTASRQAWMPACAAHAPLSNFAVMQALPRIADLSQADGLFMESLMSAIAQSDEGAKQRVRDFLEKRAGKVGKAG